jgi:ElaB/YqjD/DUF883 family membrane-anchored ribosome-binding protein
VAPETSENQTLRTVVVVVVATVLVLVSGLWFLNNTRPGLRLKCEFLNNLGACLTYGLSELADHAPAPAVTTDPRIAAQQTAQRAADRAVDQASFDLSIAVDILRTTAVGASEAASSLDDSLASIERALDNQREVFNELASMIAAGSTGEFWVSDVAFKLNDVEYARNDVDFAVNSFEFNAYEIEYAADNRDRLVADIEVAATKLETELAQYPSAAAPSYSAAQGRADLADLQATIDRAITAYESAQDEADALVAEADSFLHEATSQAAAVGAG